MVILALLAAAVVIAGVTFDQRARRRRARLGRRDDGGLDVLNAARDGADASISHAQMAAQNGIGPGQVGLNGL